MEYKLVVVGGELTSFVDLAASLLVFCREGVELGSLNEEMF